MASAVPTQESMPDSQPLSSSPSDAKRSSSKKGKEVVGRTKDSSNPQVSTTEPNHSSSKPAEMANGVDASTVENANPDQHDSASSPDATADSPTTSPPAGEDSVAASDKIEKQPSQGTSTLLDDRDKEKDKGSLNTTLTGTATRSKHRTNKTASEAHSTTAEKPSGQPSRNTNMPKKQKKQSFLSKILTKLIPCVGPSKSIPDDDHSIQAQPPTEAITERATANNEKPVDVDTPKETEKPAVTHDLEASTSTTAPSLTIPVPTVEIPESSSDPAIVVPPSPAKHTLPEWETAGVTSGAVQPPGSTGDEPNTRDGEESEGTSFTDEDIEKDMEEVEDDEERLILNGGAGIPIGPDGVPRPLLPPIAPHHAGRKCLVLDLDETLVHSSFKVSTNPLITRRPTFLTDTPVHTAR